MLNVLTISTNISAGHRRAAEAVAQAILDAAPGSAIAGFDTMELMGETRRRALTGTYLGILRRCPAAWNYLYHQRWLKAPIDLLNRRFLAGARSRFLGAVQEFSPDVIVCTQAIPARVLADLKREGNICAPILAVATDYGIHPFWAHPGIDRYAVPCAAAREELVADGVSRAAVRVTGIPVSAVFEQKPERHTCRRELGLPLEGRLILVMGGGNGLGITADDVAALEAIPGVAGVVLIAGCNERLLDEARRLPRVPGVARVVKATVSGIERYYAACDLLVSKPGGLTMSEATALGMPIVAVAPLPGQEVRNAGFLAHSGAAIWAHSGAEMRGVVFRLLSDAARLEELSARSRAVGRPTAARDIAAMALDLAGWPAEVALAVDAASTADDPSGLLAPSAR